MRVRGDPVAVPSSEIRRARSVMPVPAVAQPVVDHQRRFQAAVDVIHNLPKDGTWPLQPSHHHPEPARPADLSVLYKPTVGFMLDTNTCITSCMTRHLNEQQCHLMLLLLLLLLSCRMCSAAHEKAALS